MARMGHRRVTCRVSVVRSEGKRPLGRPRSRRENNIEIGLQEVGRTDIEWIDVALERDRWRAFVNVVKNLVFFIFCRPRISSQILANNQLDALFHVFIYFISLHVSSIKCSSSGDRIVLIHHLV